MILDVLKQFIEEECPLVSGKKIKVNYLGEKPQSYTVDTVPGKSCCAQISRRGKSSAISFRVCLPGVLRRTGVEQFRRDGLL